MTNTYPPIIKTPPTGDAVDVADLKNDLRIDFSADDALLGQYIKAATELLDGHSGILGRCVQPQEWTQSFDAWANVMRLPFPDARGVTVRYIDAQGIAQVLPASSYTVSDDGLGSYIAMLSNAVTPTIDGSPKCISVDATYGFSALPAGIAFAIRLIAGHWYQSKAIVGDGAELPFTVNALLGRYMRTSIA